MLGALPQGTFTGWSLLLTECGGPEATAPYLPLHITLY